MNPSRFNNSILEDPKNREIKLIESIKRAYKSPLYREIWKTSSFTPDMLHSVDDLSLLPLVTRNELFEATRTRQRHICTGPVSSWFMGHDQTEVNEWFPYSVGDFMRIAPMLKRLSNIVGLQGGDIVLAVVDTPPRISSSIPYLWSTSNVSTDNRLEFIVGSMEWYDTMGMSWINFIQRRRPTAIFASTKNAQALADRTQKTMNTQIRDILSETRVGIFYGKHADTEMANLLESYSLEPFEVYSPTEHMSLCSECSSHNGIHLWLDTCIPEVMPIGCEEAVPMWEATPGTKGELVITNFAECLPLIRYKTGKSVRVEGVDRCACGRTDPRVSIGSG